MRSLLWKEWHEQSWKLAFSCILLGAMTAIGLRARIIGDSVMVLWVCLIGMLLPISYCSGLLPAERADGYFESLIALPVPPRKILLAKTVLGLALCIVPLLLAMLISLVVAANREMGSDEIVSVFLRSAFASVIFFAWMLALTAQLPGETRASLVSLGIWLCLALSSGGLMAVDENMRLATILSPIVYALYPTNNPSTLDLWLAIPVQGLIALLLWLWTNQRFTRSAKELV